MRNRFTRAVAMLAGLVLAGSGLAVANAAPAAADFEEDCPRGYFCGWTGDDADGKMWKTNKNVADLGRWADDIHSYANHTSAEACLYGKRNYDKSSYLWYVERAPSGEGLAYYGENDRVIGSVRFVQDRHECDVSDYPSWAVSPTSGTPEFGDMDGDTRPDIISRDRAGRLWFSPGSGTAGRIIGTGGWNAMSALTRHGDFSRDGREDVIAREAATGRLWLYPGTGSGGLGARKLIGTGGWNSMAHLVAVGDVNGSDTPDLVAVTNDSYTRDGSLYGAGWQVVYIGRGDGRLEGAWPVGEGWWGFTAFC